MAAKTATAPVADESTKGKGEKGGKTALVATGIRISKPNFQVFECKIIGTAPYVQARFSQKAMRMMMDKMEAGPTANKGKKREARDFEADMKNAMHLSAEGWVGIPAPAFRNACIAACRMVDFKMTHAKMSIFCMADGLDTVDGMPLVKLIAGKPERSECAVRNATGVADIRVRPMWREWSARVRLKYDADQFTRDDVANLLARAGVQVGIGEGRPFSRDSNGVDWGTFRIAGMDE